MSTLSIYGSRVERDDTQTLRALSSLMDTLLLVIAQCFPNIKITSGNRFAAAMTVRTMVSPSTMMRLQWRKTYPDAFTASLAQCYQMKDIYLAAGITEWQKYDPTLVKYFKAYNVQ